MQNLSKLSNQTLFLLSFFVLFLGFQSCNEKAAVETEAEAEPEFDLDQARSEIEEANKNFMALVAAGDSVGLANAYTVDGKFMAGGSPSVVGRPNIQSAMHGMIQSGISGVNLRMENLYGTEDLLVEEGELTLYAIDQAVGEEKYIVLWKKEDGQWKLFRDIFNSNAPAE